MRTPIPEQQVDTVDLEIPRVVFGIWVIARTRSADEVEGWIDDEVDSPSPADLDEIAAAIRFISYQSAMHQGAIVGQYRAAHPSS